MKELKLVYMDNAATTGTRPEALEAMLPYFSEYFGNPSSFHTFGRKTREALETSREEVGRLIGAKSREIVFTGGGSEADNLAILGTAYARENKGKHIITSSIEHHAVMHTCNYLEKRGFEVTYLPVDEYGLVDPGDVQKAIRDDTILITIMHSNNEIGTVEPIDQIGQIAKARKIPFHTDAVQSVGTIPIDVNQLNVDMLSMSAHKFYGPKGVGALFVRSGHKLIPHIHGGAQERQRRAGTENVPGVVGMAKALTLAHEDMDEHVKELTTLRERLIKGIFDKIDRVRLNGHPTQRLPGNVNISFEFIEGESILISLDAVGIAASSGSACTSGSLEPSHVLMAIGLPHEIAHGSVRFTLGRGNTEEDVDYLLEVLPKIIDRLRELSPLANRGTL
jgi:cysteine desulfurase